MKKGNNNIAKRHVSSSGKETLIHSLPKRDEGLQAKSGFGDRVELTADERLLLAGIPDDIFLRF